MNPLFKWLAFVALVIGLLLTYGCGERPVQVGVSMSRGA